MKRLEVKLLVLLVACFIIATITCYDDGETVTTFDNEDGNDEFDDDDYDDDDYDDDDDDTNEDVGSCPYNDTECNEKWCPQGTVFVRGTEKFTVARNGPRWEQLGLATEEYCEQIYEVEMGNTVTNCENFYYYETSVPDMCVWQYEASAPGATATNQNTREPHEMVGALSKKGVLPWTNVSGYSSHIAAAIRGARLPTYEEIHYIFVRGYEGGDAKTYKWTFYGEPKCELSEESWFETCEGPRHHKPGIDEVGITGGPTGQSDYGTGIFDLLGNVAELTASFWDPECYPGESVYFGQGMYGRFYWPNRQELHGECWKFSDYAGHCAGEHHHTMDSAVSDDGFRPVMKPHPSLGENEISDINRDINFPYDVETSWFNPNTKTVEKRIFTINERYWENHH